MSDQPRRFLRRRAVRDKTGLADSTMYYLVAQGKFPRPVKLGTKMSAWDETEVDAWMTARLAERDAAA